MIKKLPKILIADDETLLRESLTTVLEEEYDVISAATGGEAVAKVKKEQVEIVILDLRLPDLDGLEVLRRIKEIDPTIAVIIVSAIKEAPTELKAKALGAFDYITKPFNLEELFWLLKKALEKRSLAK
ncbi:MAG: response regulator [bacterium]|nr:response regulator [Candidatus Margulisiibacteriota bacterium]